MGGKRVFFAGVTRCIPEIKALRGIDVAFMPMNLPNGHLDTGSGRRLACTVSSRRSICPYRTTRDTSLVSPVAATPMAPLKPQHP